MAPIAPPAARSIWINTPAHQWADLRGIPTVLGFWSTGCDASVQFLRRLERLQATFGGSIQTVAVHSPRWATGQPADAVMDAVARLRLTIPVLHDPALETFGRYDPGGWPAAVFLTDGQRVAGAVLGCEDDLFDDVAAHLGAEPGTSRPRLAVGFRKRRPLTTLSWPAGIAALGDAGRVAISDAGHDRVILGMLDEASAVVAVTGIIEGLGSPGRLAALGDGTFAATQPDAGAVVVIDPAELSVTPILSSVRRPSGLCVDQDGSLVVADGAADQLYRLPRAELTARRLVIPDVIAGSGRCGHQDGPAGRASLCQPNGLCRARRGIVFTDAASNNLRILTDGGDVISVTQNSPTDAGLADGPLHRAMLHQPVDIASFPDGRMIVADRQNDRLRMLDGTDLTTVGASGLRRPEAIAVLASGRVLVADTGNHRIVLVDPTARSARAIRLHGMQRTLSLGAAPTVRGVAHMPLRLGYPAPGPGPWEIRVESEPPELLVAPLRVLRREARGEVVVNLGAPGRGVLAVSSSGAGQDRVVRLPLEVRSG